MTRRYGSIVWVALLLMTGAVGCQPLPRPSGQGLVANPQSPLPDVPAPVTFRIVPSRSRTSVTPGGRVVDHLYQGLATTAATVAYYRRVAAEHGWQPQRELTHGGHVLMRYVSTRETLEIEVSRQGEVVSAQVRIRDTVAAPLPAKP